MEWILTGSCKSDYGVRQGCPLCPLLFIIYAREIGMEVGVQWCCANFIGARVIARALVDQTKACHFLSCFYYSTFAEVSERRTVTVMLDND